MDKIPTVFERDWDGDRSRVLDRVVPGCEWVLDGEGVATRKYDGVCCLVRDGLLYKRRETRADAPPEALIDFEVVAVDDAAGKIIGWVPVGDGPEDKWFRDAWANAHTPPTPGVTAPVLPDGTYELLGPKVQGNPERRDAHVLIAHATAEALAGVPRTHAGLAAWFETRAGSAFAVEGIVWHHPDGRMAKVKGRDFGVRRDARVAA